MSLSIVMATYNGASFIEQQLASILPYMEPNDELIISDDGSTDHTKELIASYCCNNHRILLVDGPKKGVVRNFENALNNVTKDFVLFSDQDDIWLPEKLPTLRRVFADNPDINLVLHDMFICSNEQISSAENYLMHGHRKWRHGVLPNVLFSAYFGCCMAMKKEFIASIIPFSKYTVAYDQLIGLIAEHYKCALFIEQPLIIRRIHSNNLTKRLPFFKRICFRFLLIRSYFDTLKKIKKNEDNTFMPCRDGI